MSQSSLASQLRAASSRLPGPYRSDGEQTGVSEARALIQADAASQALAPAVLAEFLARGPLDEARLAAYLAEVVSLPTDALCAGYRRTDLPSFERSKLAWALGRALLVPGVAAPSGLAAPGAAAPPELGQWVQDRNDGPAFWGARFVHDREGFERDAPRQLAREPSAAVEQLWFAPTVMAEQDFRGFREALVALAPHFGDPWVAYVTATLDAVRASARPHG